MKLINFIILVISSFVAYFLISLLSDMQKLNNYKRCVSVVKMAKKTGKLPKTLNVHERCKYHLGK